MMPSEQELDELFAAYREACPDVDTSANFLPAVWQRIEATTRFWPAFERAAKFAVALCAAACLALGLLNVHIGSVSGQVTEQSYAEALASDQNSEATIYAAAVHPAGFSPEDAR